MEKYVVEPTYDNIVEALLNDKYGRGAAVLDLIVLLQNQNGPCSISIDGDWGSGKTFFVKETKMILDTFFKYNNDIKDDYNKEVHSAYIGKLHERMGDEAFVNQLSVYYDAWEHDDDSDPLLSLIYSICLNVEELYHSIEYKPNILSSAAEIATIKTGFNVANVLKGLAHKEDWLELQKAQSALKNAIQEFFDTIYIEKADRMVIFIDELDRCNPRFAIDLLEKIKHFFNTEKISFVFSINSAQLQHTIQNYYGPGFDGYAYLDRFFDYSFKLPEPIWSNVLASFKIQSGSSNIYHQNARDLIRFFHMSIRQAAHFTEDLNRTAIKYISASFNPASFCGLIILPVLLALKNTNVDLYNKFLLGDDFTVIGEYYNEYPNYLLAELTETNEYFDFDFRKAPIEKRTSMELVFIDDKVESLCHYIFSESKSNDEILKMGSLEFPTYIHSLIINDLSIK